MHNTISTLIRIALAFLLFALMNGPARAQVSGKLYISYTQNVNGLADSIGYYLYPSREFRAIADFSARDMAKVGDYMFCAPTPGRGGRYDSLQAIYIPADQPLGKVTGSFTAGNVAPWQGKVAVSCGEAPYLRVLEGTPPFNEAFSLLDSTELPKFPFGMSVQGDIAYLWTDSLLVAVDLNTQQLIRTLPFPPGFLVQSEFNAVLGAADSAYLLISMGRNPNSRDSVHVFHIDLQRGQLALRDQYVASGVLAFPGVSAEDIIHFSRYRAHYDPRAGTIFPDQPGQTFLPGQASSYDATSGTLVVMEETSFNRQFLWLEHADTIINYLTPIVLPSQTVIVWNTLFIDNLTLPIPAEPQPGWKLYPNPVVHSLTLDAPAAGPYAIYDLQGKLVLSGIGQRGLTSIRVSGLAPGTYLFKGPGFHSLFIRAEE